MGLGDILLLHKSNVKTSLALCSLLKPYLHNRWVKVGGYTPGLGFNECCRCLVWFEDER